MVLPAAAGAQQTKQVEVTNFPNLPAVQDVFVTNPSALARFQLVGFTAATFTGDLGGPFGATQKCQSEFFEGSRMCTTPEVHGTVDIPEGLVGAAWVRPIAAGKGDGLQDISGFLSVESCDFWTTSSGVTRGLLVTAEGVVFRDGCGAPAPMFSIACCALVP